MTFFFIYLFGMVIESMSSLLLFFCFLAVVVLSKTVAVMLEVMAVIVVG
jgi:hypothetical protein